MKKIITNCNPFVLLLLPVLFALIMGFSYQFKPKSYGIQNSCVQATSLFSKGVVLFKTVCSVSKDTYGN